MLRRPERVSPTAHYTGYTWYRQGWSHPALATREGRWLHRAIEPFDLLAGRLGAPTLDGFLQARHAVIDDLLSHAIEDGRVGQVVEVAAGLSPRGWDFMRRYGEQLRYVEADLPRMAARKERLLRKANLLRPGHRVVTLDALADSGPQSLAALADSLDPQQGLAIVTEGLLNYFDLGSVQSMWRRFAGTLRRFPQGLYLSDLHLAGENRGPLTQVFGVLLGTFVRGRVYLHFSGATEAIAALCGAGFDEAQLHAPAALLRARGTPTQPGAELVRVIEARTGGQCPT